MQLIDACSYMLLFNYDNTKALRVSDPFKKQWNNGNGPPARMPFCFSSGRDTGNLFGAVA